MQRQLVPVHQLEAYRRLIAKLAWRTWRGLPAQTRSWLGVDDIIADGTMKAYRYLSKRYDPDRAQAITGLYHYLHNHFIRRYTEWYWNEKRGLQYVNIPVEIVNKRNGKIKFELEKRQVPVPEVSIQAMQDRVNAIGGKPLEALMPELSTTEDLLLQNVVSECFVLPALERVYKEASPKLQSAIVAWFLQSGGTVQGRFPKSGKRFDRLSTEFRELCFHYHVECEDCIHIVRSPTCLDNLSRRLLWIPYDLNNPTPRDLERSKQLKLV